MATAVESLHRNVGWGKGPYSTVLARWSGGTSTLEVPVCMHWHGIAVYGQGLRFYGKS